MAAACHHESGRLSDSASLGRISRPKLVLAVRLLSRPFKARLAQKHFQLLWALAWPELGRRRSLVGRALSGAQLALGKRALLAASPPPARSQHNWATASARRDSARQFAQLTPHDLMRTCCALRRRSGCSVGCSRQPLACALFSHQQRAQTCLTFSLDGAPLRARARARRRTRATLAVGQVAAPVIQYGCRLRAHARAAQSDRAEGNWRRTCCPAAN